MLAIIPKSRRTAWAPKTLGLAGEEDGQVASYFCLDLEHWRILGLDTGYNSVGLPILSMIPGVNTIPAVGGDCHLPQELLGWLASVVDPARERRKRRSC